MAENKITFIICLKNEGVMASWLKSKYAGCIHVINSNSWLNIEILNITTELFLARYWDVK